MGLCYNCNHDLKDKLPICHTCYEDAQDLERRNIVSLRNRLKVAKEETNEALDMLWLATEQVIDGDGLDIEQMRGFIERIRAKIKARKDGDLCQTTQH